MLQYFRFWAVCTYRDAGEKAYRMDLNDMVLTVAEQDQLISQAMERDESRLRNFIRRRVADAGEAEDVLQDVFYELIASYRMMKPVEQVSAWLFRVARNRITDLFRKKRPELLGDTTWTGEDGDALTLEDLLPSADEGPEAAYARGVLLESLEEALEELPTEQSEIFIAHEVMGRSFNELAEESGLSVNTLLSRKRYAVLHLRKRLQKIYEEFDRK